MRLEGKILQNTTNVVVYPTGLLSNLAALPLIKGEIDFGGSVVPVLQL